MEQEINELVKADYYKVEAISASAMNTIDPLKGGNPRKFKEFFETSEEEKEKPSKSLERGSLIHLYCENPKQFRVLEIDKPSEKAGIVADLVIERIQVQLGEMEQLASDSQQTLEEFIAAIPDEQFYDDIIAGAEIASYYPNWGADAKLKNLKSTIPYIKQMLVANDPSLICLDKKTKEVIDGAIKSLEQHPIANKLLFAENGMANISYLKESEVYWDETFVTEKGETIVKCKGKLDNVEINHDTKTIIVKDIKSTANPVYSYAGKGDKDGPFHYYSTARQMAWYVKALSKLVQNISEFKIEVYIIAVQTTGTYQTVVYKLSNNTLADGQASYTAILNRIVKHMMLDRWDMSLEEIENEGYIII